MIYVVAFNNKLCIIKTVYVIINSQNSITGFEEAEKRHSYPCVLWKTTPIQMIMTTVFVIGFHSGTLIASLEVNNPLAGTGTLQSLVLAY